MRLWRMNFAILGILLSFTSLALAQELSTNGFGVKAGFNLSNFGGSDAGEWDNRESFRVGVFFIAPLSANVAILPELMYSRKGGESREKSMTMQLDVLEMPITASMYFPLGPASRFRIFLGPNLAWTLTAKTVEMRGDERREEVVDGIETLFLDVTTGMGMDFRISNANWIMMDLRYDLGITSLSRKNLTVLDRSLALCVGIAF